MKNLNLQAIQAPELCAGDIGKSFSDCLVNVIEAFAQKYAGQKVTYIELGPEPIKTQFIIEYLISKGIIIEKYYAVDINPASISFMRESLSSILSSSQIEHRISAFEDFNADNIAKGDSTVLITMLGFQEGNDESSIMNLWMENILPNKGYLLSEMQIMSDDSKKQVMDFYLNPNMVRFSRVAFNRAFEGRSSVHSSVLVPLQQKNGTFVDTMVMLETFVSSEKSEMHLVTNYCLKYTREQFSQHRIQSGSFDILHEELTGDSSIIFQLSRRN